MELKEFVKKVLTDLDSAVTEANATSGRHISFRGVSGQRTAVEFDVAVTVEQADATSATGGIKVWSFVQTGAEGKTEVRNSTVSRVSFGVDINSMTKRGHEELNARHSQFNGRQENYR